MPGEPCYSPLLYSGGGGIIRIWAWVLWHSLVLILFCTQCYTTWVELAVLPNWPTSLGKMKPKFTHEAAERGINLVKSGVSIRKAASMAGVPHCTLRRRMKNGEWSMCLMCMSTSYMVFVAGWCIDLQVEQSVSPDINKPLYDIIRYYLIMISCTTCTM